MPADGVQIGRKGWKMEQTGGDSTGWNGPYSAGRRGATALPLKLPMQVCQEYKAAGILPVFVGADGEWRVLMGSQFYKKNYKRMPEYTAFGGKREPHECHPWTTAVREWHQETNFYFKTFKLEPMAVSYGCGGYVLFACRFPLVSPEMMIGSHEKLGYSWIKLTSATDNPQLYSIPRYFAELLKPLYYYMKRRLTP